MLRVNLTRLARSGPLEVAAAVPEGHELWHDTGLDPVSPLWVDGEASSMGGGGVLVRGAMTVSLRFDCRRCLDDVVITLEEELSMVFEPDADPAGEEDEGVDTYPLDASDDVLQLTEPIREQLILAAPRYVVCRPDCEGLCPRCGTNLNESSCDCTVETGDPRWEPLRALKEE